MIQQASDRGRAGVGRLLWLRYRRFTGQNTDHTITATGSPTATAKPSIVTAQSRPRTTARTTTGAGPSPHRLRPSPGSARARRGEPARAVSPRRPRVPHLVRDRQHRTHIGPDDPIAETVGQSPNLRPVPLGRGTHVVIHPSERRRPHRFPFGSHRWQTPRGAARRGAAPTHTTGVRESTHGHWTDT